MSQVNEIEKKLKEPFQRSDIGFRIVKVNKNNRKALALAYITSRAVMDRLDEVFGCEKWSDEYQVLEIGVTCKLSVKLNGEFITKEDAAPFTSIEALKGSFSDALKRAAVKFGIGRYLYSLPDIYVELLENKPEDEIGRIHLYHSNELSGWWVEPSLPGWALISKDKVPVPGKQKKILKQNKTVQPEIPHVKLLRQLDNLLQCGVVPKQKFDECRQKIVAPDTVPGLFRYFEKQFNLLEVLHVLSGRNVMSDEKKLKIYKKIMTSKLSGFTLIENELKALEAA